MSRTGRRQQGTPYERDFQRKQQQKQNLEGIPTIEKHTFAVTETQRKEDKKEDRFHTSKEVVCQSKRVGTPSYGNAKWKGFRWASDIA